MNDNLDIRASYDELCETEFFEWCDVNMIEPDLIKDQLGSGVLNEYMLWIYINIK